MDEKEVSRKLLEHVREFIKKQEISCAESVYQCDRVVENSYEFIEKCCEIVGYHKQKDQE